MRFLKANAKGLLVGFSVVALWSLLDWLSAIHGLPFGKDRNYADTLFAAEAGASAVFVWHI